MKFNQKLIWNLSKNVHLERNLFLVIKGNFLYGPEIAHLSQFYGCFQGSFQVFVFQKQKQKTFKSK